MAKRVPNGAYASFDTAKRMAKRDCPGDTFIIAQTEFGFGWSATDSVNAHEIIKNRTTDEGIRVVWYWGPYDTGLNGPY